METTKRLIIVLVLALVTTNLAISAEPELSNTTTASCLIKITSDPAILPLDENIIEYLLRSSGVAGKAAREVLNIEFADEFLEVQWLADETDMATPPRGSSSPQEERIPEEMRKDEFEMMMGSTGAYRNLRPNTPPRQGPIPLNFSSEQMILLRIAVNVEPVGIAAAEEFMNILIKNLNRTLLSPFDDYRSRLDSRINLANEETARAENEVRQIQEVLNEISGSRILDRGRILDEINDLRRELQVIEMNQATDQVTVEAIANQIAETQAKSREKLANDDVISELERLLESQRQITENVKKEIENGRAPAQKLSGGMEKLTRLKIELAQRREELRRSLGGELMESLNSQLANRSIQSAQNQAKIRSIIQQLRESEELLGKADDYELFSLKADIAKGNLREVIIWRDRLNRQIRMIQPPIVSVLGGE